MRSKIVLAMGLILLGSASPLYAQNNASDAPVTLGNPQPLAAADSTPAFRPLGTVPPSVVRAQAPPPPPAFPGGGPPVAPGPGGANLYNQGVVNNDADLGGFWSRCGDWWKRCWNDISGNASGAFQSSPNRQMFQSDHCFDVFSSPVTNPYYFLDPRALTEVRPVFIWQHTPSNNPIWNGGNNFDYALVGSVAITENISLVINRLGFTTIAPHGGSPTVSSNTGFSEFMLGPKITFLRSESSGTVAAAGLTFTIPDGSSAVLQDTGHLMLTPYFSIAQNFGRSQYGSFNFMNTTGYNFRTDNTRSEALFSSFHLDYEIAKRVWPFIEINWWHYTRNGGARPFDFENGDLGNFGSEAVSGHDELTVAFGTRVKLNSYIYWGIAAEFNVLNNSSGQHLDAFRLTTDLIFRY
jgi:hypothetical protein